MTTLTFRSDSISPNGPEVCAKGNIVSPPKLDQTLSKFVYFLLQLSRSVTKSSDVIGNWTLFVYACTEINAYFYERS